MSARGKWKLVAVLIIASAILGALGWQQFTLQPAVKTTITVTPTETLTATTTIPSTPLTSAVQTASARQLINHSLFLLESKGVEPYVQLAKELRKLPELSNPTVIPNSTDPRTLDAVQHIVNSVLSASPSELNALRSMFNEGIPTKRKFCTSLQAWLWVAYDGQEYNPLKTYSLNELLTEAWLRSSISNRFNSTRWKNFDEVVDRLNFPSLISFYVARNINFEFYVGYGRSARDVFARKEANCADYATFQLYCLLNNGFKFYDLKDLSLIHISEPTRPY